MTPNLKTHLSKFWAVPVAIAATLLIFQSIWLAYGIGLFIVAIKASDETRKRISESRPVGLQGEAEMSRFAGTTLQWLLAYTALFVLVVIPIVYNIHTKTNIKLLSRDAEKFIETIIDDGGHNDRNCYMGAC